MLYQDLWVSAIDEFCKRRERMLKDGLRMPYWAGGADTIPWSMKLPEEVVDRVKRVAKEDSASARRLYYTALMQYITQHIDRE